MTKPDYQLVAAAVVPLPIWWYDKLTTNGLAWEAGYLNSGLAGAIALFLLIPIAEEVVFRGFLQGWLLRLAFFNPDCSSGSNPCQPPLAPARSTPVDAPLLRSDPSAVGGGAEPALPLTACGSLRISGANLVTSFAFALAHLWQHPAWLFPGYFAVSLVLGHFRERYGGLRVPVLLHCYYNLGLWVFSG